MRRNLDLAVRAALIGGAVLALAGCGAQAKVITAITSNNDQIKFLYVQGGSQGIIKCGVAGDGALSKCRDHGGSRKRLPRRLGLAACCGDGLRGATRTTSTRSMQRVGAALLVDPRAGEWLGRAVTGAIEDSVRESFGGAAYAREIPLVHTGDHVDKAGEGARELERDSEEGADSGWGRRGALRGKHHPGGGWRSARVVRGSS
jgi:hypothetical protein